MLNDAIEVYGEGDNEIFINDGFVERENKLSFKLFLFSLLSLSFFNYLKIKKRERSN